MMVARPLQLPASLSIHINKYSLNLSVTKKHKKIIHAQIKTVFIVKNGERETRWMEGNTQCVTREH